MINRGLMVSYTGVTWKGKYYLKVGSLLLTQAEVRVATNRKKGISRTRRKGVRQPQVIGG